MDHVERFARGDADAAPLADRIVDDSLMMADDAPVDVDDLAGSRRIRLQSGDHVGIAPGRNEADVLAVMLVGNRKAERTRRLARLCLGHAAQGKAQERELLRRGGKEEIALVAIEIDGTVEGAARTAAGGTDIVAGRQRVGTELAGRLEEVGEL